jgi:hypothetical protein
MYGKLFSSTFTGSMVGAGPTVFAVWGFVIANAQKGRVELNPNLLAAVIGATIDDIEKAIAYLESPDPRSRSKTFDGRRIIREGQFQYVVANFEHYRQIRNEDDRREYNRVKQAECRAKKKAALAVKDVNVTVIDESAQSAHTEAEADTETTVDISCNSCSSNTPVIPISQTQINKSKIPQPPTHPQTQQALPGLDNSPRPRGRPRKTSSDPATVRSRPSSGQYVGRNSSGQYDESLPRLNAWAVWIEFSRDRDFPDPIPDPKDTTTAKTLGSSIPSRQELEWIFNEYLQDNEPWLDSNFPFPSPRPLRFISRHVNKYRLRVNNSRKDPASGAFHPYAFGDNIPPEMRKPSHDSSPNQAFSDFLASLPPGSDLAEAKLQFLESQA